MKSSPLFTLDEALPGGIPLKQCPESVARTIRGQLGSGRVDGIRTLRSHNRLQYLAEIDLPEDRERQLHIDGDGTLLSVIDDCPLGELPRRVKSALVPFLGEGNRFDHAGRVTGSGHTEYHVEVDLPDDVELLLVFGEGGEILRRREEGDF